MTTDTYPSRRSSSNMDLAYPSRPGSSRAGSNSIGTPKVKAEEEFWSTLGADSPEADPEQEERLQASSSRSPHSRSRSPPINSRGQSARVKQESEYRSRSHSQSSQMALDVAENRTEKKEEEYGAGEGLNGMSGIGRSKKSNGVKKEALMPPLIRDLPLAWDEAHETFEVLERCVYETKRMGTSKEQDDMMVCDCVFDRHNPDAEQCGINSDCVNRYLYIECLPAECRTKGQCRNQRFQRRQFGDVEIVLTEKKGYGLRAGSDIPSGTLIYEYIGEVVGEQTFRKRMANYATEGIKHFYFMMLQKEEYIDATKKGGIGRFANHSCNPNCDVQKWVVGRRLRMGIFSKRDILKGEEVTFNYNVDRYGHEAQVCHCGEPNCVGYIGGKTQTDIGGMNDLVLDALGITDQVEAEGLKGTKKKKSRHLDEDFTPILTPITEPDVQKVANALRQLVDNPRVLKMLLQRINITDDAMVHRELIRWRGFNLMRTILIELEDDRDIVLSALKAMLPWTLQYRNKIDSAEVEEPVRALAAGQDTELREISEKLLEYWKKLETEYRIAKKPKIKSLDEEDDANTVTIAEAQSYTYPEHRRPQAWENTATVNFTIAPVVFRPPPTFTRPQPPPPPVAKPTAVVNDRSKLDAIIALAQQSIVAAQNLPITSSVPQTPSPIQPESPWGSRMGEEDSRRKRVKIHHDNANGHSDGPTMFGLEEEEAAKKEKRLTKLVGEVVVKSMSKYKEMMDHDTFKKYARDCTHTLVEKEKKHHSYTTTSHPTLSDEKKAKMKAFTKEFTHKLLKKLKDKGKLRKPSSKNGHANGGASGSSPALSTPTALGPGSTPATTSLETPTAELDMDDIFDNIGDMTADITMDIGDDQKMEGGTPMQLRNGPNTGSRPSSPPPVHAADSEGSAKSPSHMPTDRWSPSFTPASDGVRIQQHQGSNGY